MNISINQTNIANRGKLTPKSAYKGPILKLTKTEKLRIEALSQKKAELECEMYNLHNYIKYQCHGNVSDNFYDKLDTLNYRVKQVAELIQEIKTNRLNKQIEKQKKLDIKG